MEDNARHDDPLTITLDLGMDVLAAEAEESLGTVDELAAEHFHVDARHGSGFWLSNATIRSASEGRVDLAYEEEELDVLKLPSPEGYSTSPMVDEQLNTFGSASEQDARRKEMVSGYGGDAARSVPEREWPANRQGEAAPAEDSSTRVNGPL